MLNDLETPGFVCLTEVLKAKRVGEADKATVAWYQKALLPRLAETRVRLGKLVVPAAVVENPILRNAEILCDKLQGVLDLVDGYLHNDHPELLDEAISVLDVLHEQVGQVF